MTRTFVGPRCTKKFNQQKAQLPTDAKFSLFQMSQTYSSCANTIISQLFTCPQLSPGTRTRATSHIAHQQRQRSHKQIRTNHGHVANKQTHKVPPPHVTTAQLRFLPKPESRSPGVSASKHRAPRRLCTSAKPNQLQKTRGHSTTWEYL